MTGEMGFRGQFARQQFLAAHVRFGSKADIRARLSNVCFTPKSGHWNSVVACPLCAKSGHAVYSPPKLEIEQASSPIAAAPSELAFSARS